MQKQQGTVGAPKCKNFSDLSAALGWGSCYMGVSKVCTGTLVFIGYGALKKDPLNTKICNQHYGLSISHHEL